MPKGGDLHNHLSGAVYAETFLDLARRDGMCFDATRAIVPCGDGATPIDKAFTDSSVYSSLLDSMSMRQFRPVNESGHDHFFSTFRKFGNVSRKHVPEMLTEIVEREAEENVKYLELTFAPDLGGASTAIAPLVSGDTLEEMYASVMNNPEKLAQLDDVVASARRTLDAAEASMRNTLRCGARFPRPGCSSTVRYIYELYRGTPNRSVFAGMLVGYRLANVDPRVVAVNPVMPEDAYLSMTQFDEQMQMFAFFRARYPRVHLTTHAGELWLGLVPIEGLRNHIRDSVFVAGAERIGHGVDIAFERDSSEVMKVMAERRVAVEICLTSNDVILGVRGREHPLRLYMQHGVPVTLATDDPGVSRDDMTNQYMRAVQEQGLTYEELKDIAHNGIKYSFVDADTKTRLLKDLDERFKAFEDKYGDALPAAP